MNTSENKKHRDIITQYTDEKWRDELFATPDEIAKEKAEDQILPAWVKLLDSNWLIFFILPLLLWIGIYLYASLLPQAQASRIAGMWFWGLGIMATGTGLIFALISRWHASIKGKLLYFDGFKRLYKIYRAESGVSKYLAGCGLALSLPLRFSMGSFLAVGIPFWYGLSY